ncbi:hypothetical protein DFR29_1349 [Tahibacter aquaticus]|uniref:Uncharacterized protein n=1 Tax=Tahibacter aquaticus TaxID=520092 RepID=A0A4V3DKQ4_9GAMM|nr:hypothetical protein DFR29_1349 [Tahibacter aquaticus]
MQSRSNASMRPNPGFRWHAVAAIAAVLSLLAAGLFAATVPAEKLLPPPPAASFEAEHAGVVPAGFDRRKQVIDESLAAGKAVGWAGRYYYGDRFASNVYLSLAPGAGLVVTETGCLGLYAANHGSLVDGTDGVLRISYAVPASPQGGSFPGELMPLSWGRRQYLIPPDQLAAFATAINHGKEPRDGDGGGSFLLRVGDEYQPVSGLPSLPTSMLALLRREPVEVEIASVEVRRRSKPGDICVSNYWVRVVPTAAAVPPLFVGEVLLPIDGNDRATVIASQGQSAEAEIVVFQCNDRFAPKLGMRLTTGAYNEGRGAGR